MLSTAVKTQRIGKRREGRSKDQESEQLGSSFYVLSVHNLWNNLFWSSFYR